jgi:anti-anti-sigma factor
MLELSKQDDVAVVSIQVEFIELTELSDFKQDVNRVIKSHPSLIIDFSKVRFLDSAGLGALVAIKRQSTQSQGKLCLCGLKGQVREILTLTQLDKIFHIGDTKEDALSILQNS